MTQQMPAWGPNPSGRGFLAPNPASHFLAVLYFNTHSSVLLGSGPRSRRRGPEVLLGRAYSKNLNFSLRQVHCLAKLAVPEPEG